MLCTRGTLQSSSTIQRKYPRVLKYSILRMSLSCQALYNGDALRSTIYVYESIVESLKARYEVCPLDVGVNEAVWLMIREWINVSSVGCVRM